MDARRMLFGTPPDARLDSRAGATGPASVRRPAAACRYTVRDPWIGRRDTAGRTMKRWYGKLLGFFAGAALFRSNPFFGAMVGLLIGHAFDTDWFRLRRDNPY